MNGAKRRAGDRGQGLRTAAVLGFLLLLPSPGEGQLSGVVVEGGLSQVQPPAGVEGAAARYLVGGIRSSNFGPAGMRMGLSLLGGESLDRNTGGSFLYGNADLFMDRPVRAGLSLGAEGRVFGFVVGDPLPYRAGGVEGGPTLRIRAKGWLARVKGVAGWGRSEIRIPETMQTPARTVRDELWRYGGESEVFWQGAPVWVGVGGGIHHTPGGTYRSGGVRLIRGRSQPLVELRLDVWDTPFGTETTGGVAFMMPVGGDWSVRGFMGRSEPDPLTLVQPGGGSGGVLVGKRLTSPSSRETGRVSLHEIESLGPRGARVRFTLPVREGEGDVRILGDFTGWEPRAMKRSGSEWSLELDIPAGVYHYGFLVDGAWFLPDGVLDAVADEWGRRNATLVVEAGEGGTR